MRMTVGQLRRIIRETVEEEMTRQDLNEGLWDSIKDFFGGKKASGGEAHSVMGNWPGRLPPGYQDFKGIFDTFEYSEWPSQAIVWNWLRTAVANVVALASKGKIKANSMQSLKNLAKYLEKGDNGGAEAAIANFVKANAGEIKKELSKNSSFVRANEEVTGKSQAAQDAIEREERAKNYKQQSDRDDLSWKIYGQEQRRQREKEEEKWRGDGYDYHPYTDSNARSRWGNG